MEGLRLRKKPLNEVVQNFDAFPKVPENVQEEKRATGGIIGIISFVLIVWLSVGEIMYWLDPDYEYKFPVDRDFNASLALDVDLVVAMSCENIGADIVDTSDRSVNLDQERELTMTPSKFELTAEEKQYWDILAAAQKEQQKPGQSFKKVHHMLYVASNVMKGLKREGQKKEEELAVNDAHDQIFGGLQGGIRIISSNGGVLQLIELGSLGGGGENGGDACRISGHLPIAKVSGNLHITPGKSIPMGGGAHAHINFFGSERDFNFSHRIERFGFGPRVPGLVTPLAGVEKIAHTNMELYQYYLKIVPTRVYSAAASMGLQKPITTYQYSVTHRRREISHDGGSHGMPGLNIKYELSSLMVEVRENRSSFIQLFLRLCAVVGGVFATSNIVNSLVATVLSAIFSKNQSYSKIKPSGDNDGTVKLKSDTQDM